MSDNEENDINPRRPLRNSASLKIRIDKQLMDALTDIRHQQRAASRNEVVVNSLQAYRLLFDADSNGKYVLLFDPKNNSYEQMSISARKEDYPVPSVLVSPVEARNQAIIYTRVLVEALKEILSNERSKHHNAPPLDLRIPHGAVDTKDIRSLITELRKLNRLLEEGISINQINTKDKVHAAKHINKFLDAFASTTGKGSGYLLIATGASLLTYLGVGTDIPHAILSKLR